MTLYFAKECHFEMPESGLTKPISFEADPTRPVFNAEQFRKTLSPYEARPFSQLLQNAFTSNTSSPVDCRPISKLIQYAKISLGEFSKNKDEEGRVKPAPKAALEMVRGCQHVICKAPVTPVGAMERAPCYMCAKKAAKRARRSKKAQGCCSCCCRCGSSSSSCCQADSFLEVIKRLTDEAHAD